MITRDRIIIDGYTRLELARIQERSWLQCLEYMLNEEEALCWLLLAHCRSNGLNDVCRILLALELEPNLREKALSNQRTGGRHWPLSNLPKAPIHVLSEIARIANASEGSIRKVQKMVPAAEPEVFRALRDGDVRIDKAYKWITLSPSQQLQELRRYLAFKEIRKTIRNLISNHRSKKPHQEPNWSGVFTRLAGLESTELASINVGLIKSASKSVFITEELLRSLVPLEESITERLTKNR